MPLLLLKKKPAPVAQPDEYLAGILAKGQLSDFADEIDLVGRLTDEAAPVYAQIATLQEKLKPLAEAETALKAKIAELEAGDDEEKIVELGKVFKIEVGKKGLSRSIKDMPGVRKMMGVELFMKVATVTLGNIDAYLTKPQRDLVLETKRTARGFKTIRRV
jgi:hypothetical protein